MRIFTSYFGLPADLKDIQMYVAEMAGDGDLNTPFQVALGGNFFLCESAHDVADALPMIRSSDLKQDLRDHIGYVCINNNSGGPTYFIPKKLFDRNGHITRYSDSSLYDEVCVLCGATDGRHAGIDTACGRTI